MTDSRDVLIVMSESEQPQPLLQALAARGAHIHAYGDSMKALARLGDLNPEVVVVGRDPGPPGAASLCRILSRKRPSARLYRLADPSEHEVLESSAALLSPALGPEDLAARVLPAMPGDPEHGLELSELSLGPMQLPRVLIACADGHYSGRLWITTEDIEREVVLLSGMPVWTRSTLASERLGQVALTLGLLESDGLHGALSLCRVRGLRLGEALIRTRALSGHGLHRALCEQQMTRLAALTAAGACTIRYAEEAKVAERETLLRVHPMTAMLRALSTIPQVSRAAAFQRLAELRIEAASASRSIDRFVQTLGVVDLGGLLRHARTLDGLRRLLSPTLSQVEHLSAESLCWLLLWSDALRICAGQEKPKMDGMDGMLRAMVDLSPFESRGLWSASAAAADDLPEGLSDYLFAVPSPELARGPFVALGPEVEGSAELSDFFSHYYRVKGSADPLHVLGLLGRPDADVMRTAYLEAAAALDSLPQAPDPLALTAKRNELRGQLDWAYAMIGTEPVVSSSPPPEDSASLPLNAMDMGLLREAEQYVVQGRWQEVVTSLVSRYPDLAAMPPPAQLLYAVATREAHAEGTSGVSSGPTPEQLSIGAFAHMLGVAEDSPTATLLAKRILRRRPESWNRRPSPRLSLLATSVALLAGAAVGLWLQNNSEWSQRMLRALVW